MLLMLFLHFIALLLASVGFIFAVNGYMQNNKKCITADSILGILLSIGLMQFICVVDDEMNTRLKPTTEGEPSKYKSYYGNYFHEEAFLHVFLQLFSASEDKLKIVPGLNRLLQKSTARLKPLFFIPEEPDFAVNSLQLNSGDAPWKN
ncbi:hypothetical protein TTRE_0000165101 [Trichuris trichiura]|uniref:Uncharacterized protein n=1 Tax=Trichuris trichiura TaxID=36087 RepID=A0A077YZ79_TRITR|nr:hypothetical protein TTRE_0000165101 [Trichuris trichiura]